MNFIKELFYGNISPGEQHVVQNSEYSRLAGSCDKIYSELKQTLSANDIQKLDKFCNENYAMTDLAAGENYALGFRDGVKLMLDILAGENENLRSLIK